MEKDEQEGHMLSFNEQQRENETNSNCQLSKAKQEAQGEEIIREWEIEQIKKYNLTLAPNPAQSFIGKMQCYLFPACALIQDLKYQNYIKETILDAMRQEREYKKLSKELRLDRTSPPPKFFKKPTHERQKILDEMRENRMFQTLSSKRYPPPLGYFGKPKKVGFWDRAQSCIFPEHEIFQQLRYHNNKLDAYLKWKKASHMTK